jgi:predicted nucleic acid-binding protein
VGAVVLDTNAVVRAILSPAGARRRLWLLLVYGGAIQRTARIRKELRLARESGFRASSGAKLNLRRAQASVDVIAGFLPEDAPDELWAVASPVLLSEYHRKLHDLRDKLAKPPWTEQQIDTAYRALVTACGEIVPAFDLDDVPRYTDGRDPDDDLVIHTALLGSAEVLISNDVRDVSLDPHGQTTYADDRGNVVQAMTFEHYAATQLDVDLDTIDGSRLAEAYEALAVH